MSDPTLNEGEAIISKTGGREFVSFGQFSAWVTLTNQRIIIKRITGQTASYPLSHISGVSKYEYWPSPLAVLPHQLLRIDFDNGGAFFLRVSDDSTWIHMIEAAKVNAPEMPYMTAPMDPQSLRSFATSAPKLRWIVIAGVVASFVMFCICTPVLFWVWLRFQPR